MRPIDADAALKALRKCQTYLYDARDPELKIELSSAEAAIKELPTIQPEKADVVISQPEPQWIPVSERLPEESGWYICTCHDGVSERVTFLKWQKRLKQWEKTGTRSYWKVIAWMPLPEPYRKGNK